MRSKIVLISSIGSAVEYRSSGSASTGSGTCQAVRARRRAGPSRGAWPAEEITTVVVLAGRAGRTCRAPSGCAQRRLALGVVRQQHHVVLAKPPGPSQRPVTASASAPRSAAGIAALSYCPAPMTTAHLLAGDRRRRPTGRSPAREDDRAHVLRTVPVGSAAVSVSVLAPANELTGTLTTTTSARRSRSGGAPRRRSASHDPAIPCWSWPRGDDHEGSRTVSCPTVAEADRQRSIFSGAPAVTVGVATRL